MPLIVKKTLETTPTALWQQTVLTSAPENIQYHINMLYMRIISLVFSRRIQSGTIGHSRDQRHLQRNLNARLQRASSPQAINGSDRERDLNV